MESGFHRLFDDVAKLLQLGDGGVDIGALLRLLYVAVPALKDQWRPMLWAIAILTMVVGTVAAITQRDVKRMLG
jgi:formate hydrogenlyase subunit 3/multisubunit Na+/H+ antiporter MnhD subunit